MKRKSFLVRGYDCRVRCTDPRHGKTFGKPYATPGQSHGQHGDEWRYTLLHDECAVVLTVSANEASTIAAWPRPPEGAHLTFHHPWRTTEEEVREQQTPSKCDLLPGGVCFGDASYLYAQEFFKEHGAPQFEQPERFWVAFEKYAAEHIAESKKNAAEFRVKRCPTCDATGVVPK